MSKEQWGNGYISGIKAGLKLRFSFYDYCIAMHDSENSPLGDFVYDMKHDDTFPKSVRGQSYYDTKQRKRVPYQAYQYRQCIMDYLESRGACIEARKAIVELWKEWKRIGDN